MSLTFEMDSGGGGGQPEGGSLMGDAEVSQDSAGAVSDGARQTEAEQPAAQEGVASQDHMEFSVPEGMAYDDTSAREFGALAKELGLNRDQAQKLVDYYGKRWAGAQDEFEQRLIEERTKWADGIKNHPEYGGAKLTENMNHAARFISAFGGDPLKHALNTTGAGDHPAVFEAFVKAGKLLGEDSFVGNSSGRGQDTSFAGLARAMYPDMK